MAQYRHIVCFSRLTWAAYVIGRALETLRPSEVITFEERAGHGLDQPADYRKMPLLFALVRGMAEQAGIAVTVLSRGAVSGVEGSGFEDRVALVDRPADLGTIIEPGTLLATIGDPNALWIEANVRERDLKLVHKGEQVLFSPDAGNAEPITGEVIWVSQFLDEHSRTGTVRMLPRKSARHIRADEFGRMYLRDDPAQSTIVIPKSAVQWEGCCNVVFVRDAPDRFHPRKVEVERMDNHHYRVISGLNPDEEIVTSGSFLLKTELKKSSIGAGCCDIETPS